jgi:hypothetical protein
LRPLPGATACLIGLACFRDATAVASDTPIIPRTVAEAKALQARVDRETAAAAKGLTPAGRTIFLASIRRLHNYAGAHCGDPAVRGALAEGQGICLANIYGNFLAALPKALYRVGDWQVFETWIYGIEWADDDLMGQDAERPFMWDLQIGWPRVDADPSPVPAKAAAVLIARVHQRMRAWSTAGWSMDVHVRLTALNSCYLSATLEESTYAGGGHPNEDFNVFNWNRAANRELQASDLFVQGVDWRTGLLKAYRGHLASGQGAAVASGLTDADLAPWVDHGWLVTEKGLRIVGHWGQSRTESVPDTDVPWRELGEWLQPTAGCRTP